MLAANGCALLLANIGSVSVSDDTGFTGIGQGDLPGLPVPAWTAPVAYGAGSVVLNLVGLGRTVLATGGGEDAARLMGPSVDRAKWAV